MKKVEYIAWNTQFWLWTIIIFTLIVSISVLTFLLQSVGMRPGSSSAVTLVQCPPLAENATGPLVALVIDDFGPSGADSLVLRFITLPCRITFAVMPGNPGTLKTSSTLGQIGAEMILHLPMEPEKFIAMDEKYMLMVGSGYSLVHTMLTETLAEVPRAIGVNNHMGSKATLDKPLMALLGSELKQRNLFFYDSWTGKVTPAVNLMLSAGVPVEKRDIFLDNSANADTIRGELALLVALAKRQGWAIGSGHARQATLAVLEQEIPRYQQMGIRFTSLSDLMRRKHQLLSGSKNWNLKESQK